MSLAMEWERVAASGDPKAIWAFAVRNPDTPQSELARSRLLELIETADDVPLLNVLRLVASHAVAERARDRLMRLGALATKEDIAPSSNPGVPIEVVGREEPASVTTAVREEPAVQAPEAVTSAIAVREEPAIPELQADTKSVPGREQPAARRRTRIPATAPSRLARGQDSDRPVAAENRSPSSAMFGVGF